MADKNKSISLRKLIYNDKYLIIVSILLAVLVWTVTSLNIGTDETKTISVEVPIELSDELSEQIGMKYYTIQDTVELNVTITGAKYVIGQVDKDDLSIKFDTSNVNRAGVQSIPILVSNKSKSLDFNVTSSYPSSIDAYFDVNETKTFDLYLKYDLDNTAEGYVFGNPVMSEDKVIVSGPKSYVDKIERLLVEVDFGNNIDLTEPFNTECKIDIEGVGVEASYLTLTSRTDTETPLNTIIVTLPVLKEKNLPVAVDFEDMPSEIDENDLDISYSLDTLHAGILDSAGLKTAVIGKINFNQLDIGENHFEFDITNLQGITLLDEDVETISVDVVVPATYERKTISLNSGDINIEGVENGYRSVIRNISSRSISVIVPKTVKAENINVELVCDVSEKTDDDIYPIEIILSDKSSWVYSTYTAKIELIEE